SSGYDLSLRTPRLRSLYLNQRLIDGKWISGIVSYSPKVRRATQLVVYPPEIESPAGSLDCHSFHRVLYHLRIYTPSFVYTLFKGVNSIIFHHSPIAWIPVIFGSERVYKIHHHRNIHVCKEGSPAQTNHASRLGLRLIDKYTHIDHRPRI